MLADHLNGYKIVLGSSSPRRKNFLKAMGIPFEVRPSLVEEIYPDTLQEAEISDYLAQLKANDLKPTLKKNEILITSDTVVWHQGVSLAKAGNEEEALEMLRKLNGKRHRVITSVCFTTVDDQRTENSITEVSFAEMTDEELVHYVKSCQPFDKAGAYGIQEWIGLIGITGINGSYNNVVGLPTQLVYKTLMDMVS